MDIGPRWRKLKQVWLNSPSRDNWWAMYEAYIASPEWNLKRKKVLERDQKRCRLCGENERLEVHHPPYTYDDLGEETVNDLITLCRRCHETVTSELRGRRYATRHMQIRDVERSTPQTTRRIDHVLQEPKVQDCRRSTPADAQWSTVRPSLRLVKGD